MARRRKGQMDTQFILDVNKRERFQKLVWTLLARPFTCSMASCAAQEILGGTVMGYWADENPAASLGASEGGHDFLVLNDSMILDIWSWVYYDAPPLVQLSDTAEVLRLYGDRSKWRTVDLSERLDGKEDCGCVQSLAGFYLFVCPRHLEKNF